MDTTLYSCTIVFCYNEASLGFGCVETLPQNFTRYLTFSQKALFGTLCRLLDHKIGAWKIWLWNKDTIFHLRFILIFLYYGLALFYFLNFCKISKNIFIIYAKRFYKIRSAHLKLALTTLPFHD